MATPGFTSYSVDNDKKFRDAVNRLGKSVDDLRIPFTLIASDFYRSQKAIFKLKGPGQYPDLSPSYKLEKKKAVGFIYPILKRNGFLEVAASVQKGPGNITEIGKRELLMGVSEKDIPYALKHQLGLGVPERKFLFIGPEAPKFANSDQIGRLQRWLGIINEFMVQKANQSGAGEAKL